MKKKCRWTYFFLCFTDEIIHRNSGKEENPILTQSRGGEGRAHQFLPWKELQEAALVNIVADQKARILLKP